MKRGKEAEENDEAVSCKRARDLASALQRGESTVPRSRRDQRVLDLSERSNGDI
jgi:hypothetical protein